nr:hypothetical protein [Streptomyces rimosus]
MAREEAERQGAPEPGEGKDEPNAARVAESAEQPAADSAAAHDEPPTDSADTALPVEQL